jgi:conserved repeat domain
VLVGQPTTFTVVVTNHGPARVTGLVVQDLLPAGLRSCRLRLTGSYAEATGAWTIGTLLNAQSATLTLTATVTVAGAITNRALVVARDQPDPVASNNSAAAVVNGAANADVGVTRPSTSRRLGGRHVTFTVTVTNSGPSPATGVVVTDALPAGLTLVSPTPSQGTTSRQLERRHPERDGHAGHADARGDGHGARRPGQDRDR